MRHFKFDATLNFAAVLTISSVIVSAVVIWTHTDDKIDTLSDHLHRVELENQEQTAAIEKLRTAVTGLAVQEVRLVAVEKAIDRLQTDQRRK